MVMKVPVHPTPALHHTHTHTLNSSTHPLYSTHGHTHPPLALPCPHSPTVHHHGAPLLRVVLEHSLSEAEEVGGILWHAMIRPHQKVELSHFTYRHGHTTLPCQLHMHTHINMQVIWDCTPQHTHKCKTILYGHQHTLTLSGSVNTQSQTCCHLTHTHTR